jgi:hypothetical protein
MVAKYKIVKLTRVVQKVIITKAIREKVDQKAKIIKRKVR